MRVKTQVYRKGGFDCVLFKQEDRLHRIVHHVVFCVDDYSGKCK